LCFPFACMKTPSNERPRASISYQVENQSHHWNEATSVNGIGTGCCRLPITPCMSLIVGDDDWLPALYICSGFFPSQLVHPLHHSSQTHGKHSFLPYAQSLAFSLTACAPPASLQPDPWETLIFAVCAKPNLGTCFASAETG
jgi:hypothetical protein